MYTGNVWTGDNYLWEGREQEFIELTKVAVSKADFTKVSKEELNLITKKEDLGEAVECLHQLGGKNRSSYVRKRRNLFIV